MKIFSTFLLLLFTLPSFLQAQVLQKNELPNMSNNCFTMQNHYSKLESDPTYSITYNAALETINRLVEERESGLTTMEGDVITIPVVYHVIHNGETVGTGQNLSETYLQAQLDQLNLDFRALNSDISNVPAEFSDLVADFEVEFCLAVQDPDGNETDGILRYDYGQATYSIDDFEDTIKPETIWDRDSYMNFWTADLQGGLLGYAQFPGGTANTDGIVCTYDSVGSVATPNPDGGSFAYGRTATHEVGHWLSLRHIWGDDGTACTGSDLVDDTPNQAGSSSGIPTHPRPTCGSNDMFMNYMDYTSDLGMVMFSEGQKARSDATLLMGGPRASLMNSIGCVAPTGFSLEEITTVQEICTIAEDIVPFDFELTLSGEFSGTVTFSTVGLPGGITSSFTPSNPTTTSGTYSVTLGNLGSIAAGTYPFTVEATDGTNVESISLTLVLTTGAPSVPMHIMPSDEATGVSTSPTLSWTAVADASEYIVEVANDDSFLDIVTSTQLSETSTQISGLLGESTYYWRVAALNPCAASVFSNSFSFTTSLQDACEDAITDGGFEESTTPNPNWDEFSSNGFILIDDTNPNTGSNSAWLGGADDELAVVWQSITIPSNAILAKLRYYYEIQSDDVCGFDFGGPMYLDGTTVTPIKDFDLCSTTDTGGSFIEDCVDLTQFIGQTIDIGFYAFTDVSFSSSFFVDDVELIICTDQFDTIPVDTNDYIADYEVTDLSGWTHYLDDNGTPCDYLDDYLLVSVEKNGEDIGSIGDAGFEVSLRSNPSSSLISAPYNDNSSNWYTFNRFWNLTPVTQPTNDVGVRYYFADNDISALESSSGFTINDPGTELSSWKINNNPTTWDSDPLNGHMGVPFATGYDQDGYWGYLPGTNSSTTEFSYVTYPGAVTGPYHMFESVVGLFSGGGASISPLVLPIELASFDAFDQVSDAVLDWVTLSERNHSHFDIEYSTDGIQFSYLATVNSMSLDGNSDEELTYQYTDKLAIRHGNQVFYRLKQVDLDGEFTYSEIRLVDFSDSIFEVGVFPNPATRNSQVVVIGDDIQTITVTNINGKVVFENQFNQSVKSLSLDVNEYSSGTYLITVNQSTTKKLVIQ